MSNALSIAGVTAVLQHYLTALYASASVKDNFPTTVTVSCLAPDQIQNLIVNGRPDAESQVNIFLHQVTHNPAWRNVDLPSMSPDGASRRSSPPLALNLHYLLTVYGSDYLQAEALLGYALMMLHEAPVLTRTDISAAITALTTPVQAPFPTKLTAALATAGLADQIELIKITPEGLSREEMAWLWTALKADYRPTYPFQVSVVLMQPTAPTSLALPVLQVSFGANPVQPPQITQVPIPGGRQAVLPGDALTVSGDFLSGATRASISNNRYRILLQPAVTQALGGSVAFTMPALAAGDYPAGAYDLEIQWVDPLTTVVTKATNSLPIAVAPSLPAAQNLASAALPAPPTGIKVTLGTFSPPIRAGQTVALAISSFTAPPAAPPPPLSVSAPAQPFTGPTAASLDFVFEAGLPTGVPLLARLLVDGIGSPVTADLTLPHPVFTGPLVTIT
jgi:hypothetical protein